MPRTDNKIMIVDEDHAYEGYCNSCEPKTLTLVRVFLILDPELVEAENMTAFSMCLDCTAVMLEKAEDGD